jgi:hypothetical protein
VVRSTSTDKVLTVFSEVSCHPFSSGLTRVAYERQNSELQAEKRGNFVVVGSIEGSKVVSWSLNVSVFDVELECILTGSTT